MKKRFNLASVVLLSILFILSSFIIPLASAATIQFNATFDDDSDLVSRYTCTVSGGNLRCINGQTAKIVHKLIDNSETRHNSTIELRAKFTTLKNNKQAWFYKDENTTSNLPSVWRIQGTGSNIVVTNDEEYELEIGTVDDKFHTWKFVNLVDNSVDVYVDDVYKGNIAYSANTGNGTYWLFKCTQTCDFTVDWMSHYDDRCSDGTQSGQCSASKPFYCDSGTLTNNCGACGCDANYACQRDNSCKLLTCSDGTQSGQCSTTKPKYCDNGNLVDKCDTCGCDTNYGCQPSGACEILTCSDGTKSGQCSTTINAQYCDEGTIINNCNICGCSSGTFCSFSGTCVEPPKFEIVQITTNTAHQTNPAIYDDKIVWQDLRNGNYDIFMYDLSTGQETQITTNTVYEGQPAIYDNRIVWEDNRNGNYDIYMYDLSTGEETQITTNTARQTIPAIYDDKIVWQDKRYGDTVLVTVPVLMS